MQKSLALVFILFFINKETRADCNPAFTLTVQNSTVQVQATNTAPHLYHSWRFEGSYWAPPGTTATYTYVTTGTHTITHFVIDSLNNCIDSAQQTVVITSVVVCHAGFTIAQNPNHYNEYSFTSTSGTNTGTISYNWTVNGTPVTQAPNMTYIFPHGANNVCLAITTSAGCIASACQTVIVSDTTICNWSASFVATPAAANPKQVSFVPNPSSNQMRYNWNFGDGYTSTLKAPTHTYHQSGTYEVRLAIFDTTTGCLDTIFHQLHVQGSPADSCTVSYTYAANPVHPGQISFTAISNQTITSQTWWINDWNDPYDSIFINTSNPTYTFTDTGYYNVCLYITTNTGCTASACYDMHIDSLGNRQAGRIPSYPNPAKSIVSFHLKLIEQSGISVTVYNLSGYAVYQMQKQGVAGTNEITIPVQQLNSGQYFIDVKYGDQQKRSIFQKL